MGAVRKRKVDRRYDSVTRLFRSLGLRLDGIQVSIEVPAPGLVETA